MPRRGADGHDGRNLGERSQGPAGTASRARPFPRFLLGAPQRTLAQHRPYPLDRGLRGPDSVVHAVLFVGLRDHVDLVDLADRAARVVGDDEVDLGHVRLEGTDDRVPYVPDVRRVLGRDKQRGRELLQQLLPLGLGDLVDLIEDEDPRHVAGADLVQHLACDLHLGAEDRVGRIDDLQQQGRLERLVERRAEAGDEVVRKLPDETNRVRNQDARPTLGPQRTDGGVEGREQLVGDEHVRAGERAHQRRLARVGVPDQRDAQRLLTPRPSRLRLVFDGGQLRLELGDAVADLAAIELHGGLPGAPQPDAAALAPAAGLAQPGGYIGEPRDLDLQPRRSARRVPMEDLDDHTRAIQYLRGRGRALDVAELARRQLVVDDDDGGARPPGGRGRRREVQRFGLVLLFLFVFFDRFLLAGRTLGDDTRAAGPGGQLHQLALAEQRGGAETLALLSHLADDLEAERLAQALELLQRGPLFRVRDA